MKKKENNKNKNLQSIILENPFSFEFDEIKISTIYKSKKTTKTEKDIIDFFSLCNHLFLMSNGAIIKVFDDLNLSKDELISFIFEALNRQTLQSKNQIYRQILDSDSRIVSEKNQLAKFVTESGNSLRGKDILENGGNVLNVLIEIINNYNFDSNSNNFNKFKNFDDEKLTDKFLELWYYAIHLYSFYSFYEVIKYENGLVEINDNKDIFKIRTSSEFKKIRSLISISEVRNSNHINEYLIYLRNINKKIFTSKTIVNFSIEEDSVVPIIGKSNNTERNIENFAKYLKLNKYLEDLKLDYYDGLTINEIYNVITIIVDLVNLLIQNKIDQYNIQLNEIPHKIQKAKLISSINECTGHNETIIEKIIDALTEKKVVPYFWRSPLFENENYIYLSFSLLSAPNTDLLLESIIEKSKIKEDLIINSFKETIRKELLPEKIKYTFEEKEINNDYLKNNLLYELQDYFIFIELKVLKVFPIESNEINSSLAILRDSAEQLKSKAIEVAKEIEIQKPIIPILLINYTCFSGLLINGIPTVDIRLLENYFITGKFQKIQVKYLREKSLIKVFNQIEYYQSEEDFCGNFLNFLTSPTPIMELFNKMAFKEITTSPKDAKIQVIIENYEFLDDEDFVSNELYVLKNLLDYQYFNEIGEKENNLYIQSINYHLTNVFHLLAFGEYDLSIYRFNISDVFQKSRLHGFFYLINYFRNALNQLSKIKIASDKRFNLVSFNTEETLDLIYSKIFSNNIELRLSEFTIDENLLNKKQEKEIISLSINVLSSIFVKKITNDELENYISLLHIISAYRNKYNLHNEFYSICSNLISTLNFDFNYQLARNLSEEILLVSMKDKMTHRGWGILFQTLDQQKNIYDATIYGCLYITSLSVETKLNYSEIIDVFYNVLKFARNARVKDLVDEVFMLLKTFKLKTYDEQKIYLSYYLSIINRKENDSIEIINSSIDYFKTNSKKITKYQEKGAFPWLNYFYNIKRLKTEGFFLTVKNFDDIIITLEGILSLESLNTLKDLHFGLDNLKDLYIQKLKNILETYSYSDYIFEIQNLELHANHLIEKGIRENDPESIILSGFVFNDITLMYKNTIIESNTKVIVNLENSSDRDYLNNYFSYIIENISIKSKQILVYLFTSKNSVYALVIDSNKSTRIINLEKWDIKLMNEWLKKKDKFYFDSTRYFDITDQENSYNELLDELSFSDLNIDDEFDEVLISTNLDLSKFPVNLIINKNNFIGSSKPITNVLLLEWYLNNHNQYFKKDYTISAWIPTEDKDPDIIWSYEKLEPVLRSYQVKIINESHPKEIINSDINIFLAHGELNSLGFKAVYKSDDINSAVFENRQLFGNGEVAILFICNSGYMNEDLFSNSIISLVHELIQLGYKSVIAPCWSLEVTIPQFWLDEFLKNFNEGYTISESVYMANNILSDYKESISNAYLVPEGRLAMHLYGNPNLKLS